MIEALLRPLSDLSGFVSAHLIERDGFVVFSKGPSAGTDEIERWQALIATSPADAMTTLVMENGYLILSPVALRILVVKCERRCNLGLVRRTMSGLQWPA